MRIATRTQIADPTLPLLIQGGMGVAVSNHRLARAVAMTGHLGVVSGTAIA
jgi:nitronate monooxygenase